MSIWKLPIVALAGTIGYITNIQDEPIRPKINKRQTKNNGKTPDYDYNLEMQMIADFEQLQAEAK